MARPLDRRRDVPPAPLLVESLGPTEHRMSFRVGDSWCRGGTIELGSGVRLVTTSLQFDPSFTFTTVQPSAEIELVVSKGGALHVRTTDEEELERGGNTIQLARTRSDVGVQIRPTSEATMECVAVSMSEARLRELLGVSELPAAFRPVTESAEGCSVVSRAVTPALLGLLDEIMNSDARGASRRLWHEAKALELVALMTDELVDAARASEPRLSKSDIDRLERVRTCLVANIETPPTLTELARVAGMNETKLKGHFRARFGTSVFAYLRRFRMEEARRLLSQRHLNVTEVAQRVGYANPSKFAAAFRRQFGVSPSTR